MPWSPDTRLGPAKLLAVCVETVISVLPIVAAVAAAGVVIGVLNLTGLGLMLSGLILQIGGSNLWLVLVLTALASFVLGMGLPTSAAYLLLAVLVAPALEKMGVPPIVSHMFIFYYGLVSAITPPVALAAYAAAGISGAGTTETGIEAVRLGFVKLLVPFLVRHHARTVDAWQQRNGRGLYVPRRGSGHFVIRELCRLARAAFDPP